MDELKQKNEEIAELKSILQSKEKEIESLKETIAYLRRKKYAPQSESKDLGIFNEAEELFSNSDIDQDDTEIDDVETEDITYTRKKNRGKRTQIPADLPRRDDIIDLKEEEKICPHSGEKLVEIGEEVSEKLEITPAKIIVVRTIRKKYACKSPCCNGSGNIKIAPAPLTILPKTLATASLISYILNAKYTDALPLYRQEDILSRLGISLHRQTMARWLISVYEQLIPIYNLLQDILLSKNYLQMDETPVQVLKEAGKKATSKSYMWVRFVPGDRPIVLYDYSPTRSGAVPLELLEGFSGYLQCDGYDGYSAISQKSGVIRVGCMDHSRRKFVDAFNSSNKKNKIGKKGLVYFQKLYNIEDKTKEFSSEGRLKIRCSEARPILEEMKKWIDDLRPKISPNSLAGKAINYTYNEWIYLTRYLEDGNINISNIWVENKIRPFAIGRKNWLFSASVDGAKASALFYSLIETAKANGLDPFDYLNNLLEKIPSAKTVEDYEKLLPLKDLSKK